MEAVPVLLALVLLAGCVAPAPPVEAAPSWSVGDAWSYVLRWENGTRAGEAAYRVLGEDVVLGQPAYRVEERLDFRREVDPPRVGVVHFEKATLHQVFDVCAQGGVVDDCRGRLRELDFPLWEGKRWERSHLAPLTQEARRLPSGDWRVSCVDCQGILEDVYRPSAGLWSERLRWTSDGVLRWTLEP